MIESADFPLVEKIRIKQGGHYKQFLAAKWVSFQLISKFTDGCPEVIVQNLNLTQIKI